MPTRVGYHYMFTTYSYWGFGSRSVNAYVKDMNSNELKHKKITITGSLGGTTTSLPVTRNTCRQHSQYTSYEDALSSFFLFFLGPLNQQLFVSHHFFYTLMFYTDFKDDSCSIPNHFHLKKSKDRIILCFLILNWSIEGRCN